MLETPYMAGDPERTLVWPDRSIYRITPMPSAIVT
jgi:hypothetical protein